MLFCLWALAMFSAVALGQELSEKLQVVFNEGVAAEKAGNLADAAKAFQEVLRQGGKVAYVYNNLGTVYQQQDDHARAIEQFRAALRLQPDYAAPRILLGASLLATGQVAEATKELERAIKVAPREPLARLELARAYDRAGNFTALVEQYRALRELAPQDAEYAYQLGRAYLKQAEWTFREIKRFNPESARAYQILAETYRGQGRADLAVQAFQHATQVDPKLPGIHLALAQIYLERGQAADGRREIEQELAIAPESIAAKALQQSIASGAPKP